MGARVIDSLHYRIQLVQTPINFLVSEKEEMVFINKSVRNVSEGQSQPQDTDVLLFNEKKY